MTLEDGLGNEDRVCFVPEGATMPHYKTSEALKLGDGVVGEESSLVSLIAFNSDSNLGNLNHVNVVGAVTDCATESLCVVFLDKLNHLGLLVR
jgi:hypothetical protein